METTRPAYDDETLSLLMNAVVDDAGKHDHPGVAGTWDENGAVFNCKCVACGAPATLRPDAPADEAIWRSTAMQSTCIDKLMKFRQAAALARTLDPRKLRQ